MPDLTTLTLTLLTGALILLVAFSLLQIVAAFRAYYPGQQAVFDALQIWLHRAIFAGEHIALQAMQQAESALASQDRKAVADSIYDLLPDTLIVSGTPIPVGVIKRLVPREQFEQLVQDAYEATAGFIQRNETYLRAQVEVLI